MDILYRNKISLVNAIIPDLMKVNIRTYVNVSALAWQIISI